MQITTITIMDTSFRCNTPHPKHINFLLFHFHSFIFFLKWVKFFHSTLFYTDMFGDQILIYQRLILFKYYKYFSHKKEIIFELNRNYKMKSFLNRTNYFDDSIFQLNI